MAATGFGAAAAAILDGKLPQDAKKPILARRKSLERNIEDTKRQEREDNELAKAKKSLAIQSHQQLRAGPKQQAMVTRSPIIAHNPGLEKQLKKIATQGIVTLFNAVRQAQGVRAEPKVPPAVHARVGASHPRAVGVVAQFPYGIPPAGCEAQTTARGHRWLAELEISRGAEG